MTITEIKTAVEPDIEAQGCYLVDITISKDNDIEITVDRDNGSVDMDDCVAINDAFEQKFSREQEDYSLTVSSAGLDQPFKILRQYQKAVGTQVTVSLKGGRKITGTLSGAEQDCIRLRYSALEQVEGKKKKVTVDHDDTFQMSEINSTVPYIEFER